MQATKNKKTDKSNTSAEKLLSNDAVPRRQVLFIGVSGPTGSGKSTIAAALSEKLASPLRPISADFFFKIPGSTGFGSCNLQPLHTCWEHPDSVNHTLLLKRLRTIKQLLATATVIPEVVLKGTILRGKRKLNVNKGNDIGKYFGKDTIVVVVEGFLLFADKNVTAFLDYCLFLNINWETGDQSQHRRAKVFALAPLPS